MFKTSMELKKQGLDLKEQYRDEVWKLKKQMAELQYEMKCARCEANKEKQKFVEEKKLLERQHALTVEEEKNKLRGEMQKALITSDLKRVEAVARFETYKEMDTKDERKHIRSMLDKAIVSLGNRVCVSGEGGGDE